MKFNESIYPRMGYIRIKYPGNKPFLYPIVYIIPQR